MTGLYAPPDIEGAVVTLLDAGTSADVSTAVPNPRPAGPMIRVTRAGGSGRNLIQSTPRVLVECWDADEVAAFNLARLAYARLWAAADSFLVPGVYVTRIELTEPVNFPDPDTDQPRYQFIAALTTSLTEVTP